MSTPDTALPAELRETRPKKPKTKERSRFRQTAELMWATAVFDYRRRYAETAFGVAWGILEPIIYSFVLYLVFTRGLRFGGTIPNYVAMLILNVTLFQWFRGGAKNAMRSLVNRKAWVKSVAIPRMVLVITGVLSATLLLATSLPVAFAWIFSYDIPVTLDWLLFPVLLLYLLGVTIIVGTVLAALFARWRDTAIVWSLMGRILFLTSGVIFPFDFIKGETFQTIAAFNPLCPAFVYARKWMIDTGAPSWPDASGSTLGTWAPFIVLAALGVLAVLIFKPFTRRVAETV